MQTEYIRKKPNLSGLDCIWLAMMMCHGELIQRMNFGIFIEFQLGRCATGGDFCFSRGEFCKNGPKFWKNGFWFRTNWRTKKISATKPPPANWYVKLPEFWSAQPPFIFSAYLRNLIAWWRHAIGEKKLMEIIRTKFTQLAIVNVFREITHVNRSICCQMN